MPLTAITEQRVAAEAGALSSRARPDRSNDRIWKLGSLAAGLALVGVVAFAVLSAPAPKTLRFPAAAPPALAAGTPAPGFALPPLGGGPPLRLSGYLGTPVVVNFFASWSSNCQPELSVLAALAREPGAGVAVLGVDTNDQKPSVAQAMLATAHATYPVAIDPKAQISTQYLVTALPATYFIGRSGRVLGAVFGPQSTAQLSGWIKRLRTGSSQP